MNPRRIQSLRWRIATLICFAHLTAACGDSAGPAQIEVHGAKLVIPPLEGFAELKEQDNPIYKFLRTSIPPELKVEALFVPPADLLKIQLGRQETLNRYMFIQTLSDPIKTIYTSADFNIGAWYVRQNHVEFIDSLNDGKDDLFKGSSERLSDVFEEPISANSEQLNGRGVFLDEENAIGYIMTSNYSVASGDGAVEYAVAVASTNLRVADRSITMNLYTLFDGEEDIEWLRSSTKSWAEKIINANPNLLDIESTSAQ